MASTKLSRTAGTPTSNKKFTISYWVKQSGVDASNSTGEGHIFDTYTDGNNRTQIHFDSDDVIDFRLKVSGTNIGRLKTTRKFRDPSAWYHIVAAIDTTQSTEADRIKLYINGTQETSFSTGTYPSQNADFSMAGTHTIGAYGGGTNYYNGLLAHFHFTDGYTYSASTFGETDSTSGIWVPKTNPSVTYGTNGFFLKFENSGAMGTDSSGQSNTFTVSGTLTQNVDTPTNNFATLNPLPFHHWSHMQDNTNGNTTLTTGSGSEWKTAVSTMGVEAGKWYFEAKLISTGSNCIIGAVNVNDARQNSNSTWYIGQSSTGQGYQNNGAASNGGASYGATYANGDIIGCAMDLDNNKLYFSKNGVFQNSGVPTSGSTGTGALSLTADTTYTFALSGYAGTVWNINYGSGFFGTTAVASANADANGHGAMEYSVPSGYYTLNTKNIKEFG